jgi:oligopeptide transport system substrate-binding protein
MKKYLRWLTSLSIGLIMIIGGCKGLQKEDHTVTINIGIDPPTLSSLTSTKVQVVTVIRQLSEGLTRINLQGEIKPALAEKIEPLDDGLKYKITLRPQAQWSPGHPVKSQDFERTYKSMLTKKVPSPKVDQLFTIKNARLIYQGKMSEAMLGIQIISDSEMIIELEEPNPVFLHQLSTPIYFPVPEKYEPDIPSKISCGAYYLKEWTREKQLVLERNPYYWDAANVKIPRLIFTTIADAHTQFEMFNEGQIDWCGSPFLALPEEAEAELDQKGVLKRFHEASVHMLVFNTRKGIFTNQKIRQAFGLGIDRPSLVKHQVYNGKPAASFVPPNIMGQDTPYFPYYAPEESKRLFQEGLSELGLTLESLPKIRFLYQTKSPYPRRAQAIQDGWNKLLGAKVDLVGNEWQMLVQTLLAGDFDVASASWVADFPDPINFLQLYQDAAGGRNYPGWEDGRYQYQLELAMHNPAQRKQHLLQAERLLLEQMVIAPIAFPESTYLINPKLKDVYCDPLGYIDLRWAYLE